jgi:putative spermidine/putrescine transport system permease protein
MYFHLSAKGRWKLMKMTHYDKAVSTSPAVLLPGLLYLLFFFIVPLCILLRYSFYTGVTGTASIHGYVTLQNYIDFFRDPYFVKVFWSSLRIAAEVCIADVILAYPVAYFLARSRSPWVPVISGLSYLPLLASTVVTSFGWMIILSDTGFLNHMLLSLGIIHAPVKIMYSESGVVTALIQSTLPFMIVSIRNVLFMVDHFTEEAASTLGAHPYQVFFRITLPLSFPGIAAGTLLVFVTSMSAFVTPELIGGGQVPTLASIVLRETQMNLNWSLSSTISVIILIMTLIVVFSYNRLLESKWLGGGGKS